ncbi:hypothetical protein AAII07_53060, partial [Microvirga sp. 0TCS3.31]
WHRLRHPSRYRQRLKPAPATAWVITFGIICCRKNQNKMAILQRSKDAVRDDRGFVLVLDDDDILALLDAAASGGRREIFHFLERRHRDIVF